MGLGGAHLAAPGLERRGQRRQVRLSEALASLQAHLEGCRMASQRHGAGRSRRAFEGMHLARQRRVIKLPIRDPDEAGMGLGLEQHYQFGHNVLAKVCLQAGETLPVERLIGSVGPHGRLHCCPRRRPRRAPSGGRTGAPAGGAPAGAASIVETAGA